MSFLTEGLMSGRDWRGLERGVARLMGHCGWRGVKLIGQTGDKGADILATGGPRDPQTSYAIQVKSITSGNYVGPSAVDEVLAAMATYGAHKGVVATNGTFRDSAYARVKVLQSQGYSLKLWNGAFLENLFSRMPDDSTFKRQPREYQSPIIQKAITSVQSGSKRLNFVLATGLGKSLVAAEIVRRLWQEQGFRRILVLCHIKDLADQLEVSFWSQLNKNIPTWTFYEGRPPKIADGVNCGLFQTLANKLDLIEPGSFDLILVDEAHHAPAASYRNCLVRLNAKVLIGMTATPWHNLEGAFEDVFGERIATISLPEGMAMGYLARVKYLAHCDNIHWEELHKLSGKNVSIRDLNKKLFIPQRDEAIVQEIKRVCNEMANPRICIFCPSIEHGKRFAALIASRGISCKPLSGADKVERWKSLMEFAYGRIKAVTAVDVLNEGIDVPDVNIVVFLRVTHSHRIFIQQLGRGLRITESKAELEVLDFVTDIRRLAEILELERSRKEAGTSYQEIMLKDEIRFTSNKVKSFMQQWMEDLSQVATTDEEDTLKFPDFSETNEYDS